MPRTVFTDLTKAYDEKFEAARFCSQEIAKCRIKASDALREGRTDDAERHMRTAKRYSRNMIRLLKEMQ